MNAAALQIAVYNKLTADAPLMLEVVNVWDNPTQVTDPDNNALFPIITIGDDTLNTFDTDTELGTDATISVHTWSRAQHKLEAKEIQSMIYRILHRATITIEDSHLIDVFMELQTIEKDPDGVTIHGVQQFKVLYQED